MTLVDDHSSSAPITLSSTSSHPPELLAEVRARPESKGHATEPFPPVQPDVALLDHQTEAADADSTNAGSLLAQQQRHDREIEMDALTPASHRRRTSGSLSSQGRRRSSRRSSQSRRTRGTTGPTMTLADGKISEEGSSVLGGTSWSRQQQHRDQDSFSDEDLHDDEETGLTGKDKRRKRAKKKRHTRLDQRIVREGLTAEDKRVADQNVFRKAVINVVLILLWYLFSLSISIYNKWMFASDKLNFPFPLFTTAVHMLVQFTLASLVLLFIPSLRPHNGHISDGGQSRNSPGAKAPLMTKMFYFTRIGPCGAATGLDIGLGNTSLKFITLTFYTMCKSSALAFVLLFAFIFRLETPTWRLVGVIATMTVGVIMMVAGEVEFKLVGFVLVISAAFFSGFRWGLTQILLLRNPATSNPFSSIFFLAPVMFVTLISIAIPVEGFGPLFEALGKLVDEWGPLHTPLLILFPGTIAFLMTASEFALLQRTSVVTLSIAGIFKEAVTITASLIVFGDTLTLINILGLFVTMGAIAAYNYIKITKMRRDALEEAQRSHIEAVSAFSSSGGSSRSGGSSGDDDESGGEEAGLLRRSEETDVFTADGDVVPRPGSVPVERGRKGTHEREE